MMKRKALILGVTGQDGSYLADLLLGQGYEIHGLYRKSATGNLSNVQHLINDNAIYNSSFFLHMGDLLDTASLFRVISKVEPDEIYNEADQDHVRWSYEIPSYSNAVTAGAVTTILEVIKQVNPKIKYFQPCTSNMFGISDTEIQSENSPFNPQSPYAIAKVAAFFTVKYYRSAYGIFASNGILFNHESPRRTSEYLSRKVTKAAARIKLGLQDTLVVGDLDARIDWGHASDYMNAASLILRHDIADDFVIASGESHSVRDLIEVAFEYVGLNWRDYVSTSAEFIRPTRTSALIGDISKITEKLGFERKYDFSGLIEEMVEADLRRENLGA